MHDANFPFWLRIDHWINAIVMILLIRSGIQILADHPKLYFNDDAKPGSEWIKFGKKIMPKGKLWTSLDEAETASPVLALPGGHHNLGSGRRWHFLAAMVWLINGIVYVSLLLLTGEWMRLVPTHWSIFSQALETFFTYLTLHTPPASAFHPYDPLQQLSYFVVVFILTPLMVLTALAMSPAITGRFPWYSNLFGGRQGSRSIHFIIMVLLSAFILLHVVLVLLVGFPQDIGGMTVGSPVSPTLGLLLYFSIIGGIILINAWASWYTLKDQHRFQLTIDTYFEPLVRKFFGKLVAKQHYSKKDISLFFRVNGYPPKTQEYLKLGENDFQNWQLKITGAVEKELSLSLDDLKKLPKTEQITKHNCIQGWSAIAQWGGVKISELLKHINIHPGAKYIVFYAYDVDSTGKEYYSSLTLEEAKEPQSILAYEMNWNPLPLEHGAPLRLRMESKLGFKMVKYIKEIAFVETIKNIGQGQGGYREDTQYYDAVASI